MWRRLGQCIELSRYKMYKIIDISEVSPLETETLGVKDKFWFRYKLEGDEKYYLYMYKKSRPNTGEHWAEIIACEIAKKLKIPCAKYYLATYRDNFGIITKNLIEEDQRLIHGNELIGKSSDDSIQEGIKNYQQTDHRLSRVISFFKKSAEDVMRHMDTENKELTALDVFLGYIMFDVLISNQDRHNQNWGIVRTGSGFSYLCPTYDHGSSLGRNESEQTINRILNAKFNQTNIYNYVCKARSAFYPNMQYKIIEAGVRVRPMLTIDALAYAGRKCPDALKFWKKNLTLIQDKEMEDIVINVPDDIMSKLQKEFALAILTTNKSRILNI